MPVYGLVFGNLAKIHKNGSARMNTGIKTASDKRKRLIAEFKKQRWLQAMVIPGIIFTLIFCYIPMYGVIIAFKDFNFTEGIMGSQWVGLKHFRDFLQAPNLGNIFYNTLGITVSRLIIGFPIPILFALMLNELTNVHFKKAIQTVSYLPQFVSFVVIAGMMSKLFATDGAVNDFLVALHILKEPVQFMGNKDCFWGLIVGSGIWQGMGYGSILYLAAITGVDQSLYESATLDGAGRFKKWIYVTIPSIMPIVVIQLVMSMNGILSAGFDNILLLQNSQVMERAEVLDTYIYKVGLQDGRYSYSTAVGLFTSVIRISLVLLTNYVSKRVTEYGLW